MNHFRDHLTDIVNLVEIRSFFYADHGDDSPLYEWLDVYISRMCMDFELVYAPKEDDVI